MSQAVRPPATSTIKPRTAAPTFRGPLETPLTKGKGNEKLIAVNSKPRTAVTADLPPQLQPRPNGVASSVKNGKPTIATNPTISTQTKPASSSSAAKKEIRGYSELKKSEEGLKETVDRLNQTINKQKEEMLGLEGRIVAQAKEMEDLRSQIEREKRNVKETEEAWKQRMEEWNKAKQQEVRAVITSHANKYEKLQLETKSIKDTLHRCEKKLEELGIDPESLQAFEFPKSEEELQREIEAQRKEDEETQRAVNLRIEQVQGLVASVEEMTANLRSAKSRNSAAGDEEGRSCNPFELIVRQILSPEFDFLDQVDVEMQHEGWAIEKETQGEKEEERVEQRANLTQEDERKEREEEEQERKDETVEDETTPTLELQVLEHFQNIDSTRGEDEESEEVAITIMGNNEEERHDEADDVEELHTEETQRVDEELLEQLDNLEDEVEERGDDEGEQQSQQQQQYTSGEQSEIFEVEGGEGREEEDLTVMGISLTGEHREEERDETEDTIAYYENSEELGQEEEVAPEEEDEEESDKENVDPRSFSYEDM